MTQDLSDMPLRNHQQVHLLNERSEPQSNQQSAAPVTQVTHQTQNSAIAGLAGRNHPSSLMGATNVSQPMYLETTNIIPNNGGGIAGLGMNN